MNIGEVLTVPDVEGSRFYRPTDDEFVAVALCHKCGRELGEVSILIPLGHELVPDECDDSADCKRYREDARIFWVKDHDTTIINYRPRVTA